MSGRPVPWASWAEWELLRADLWSEDPARQEAGLQQVCAWRLRGKLPLGVDVTAQLMDVRRADEDWQRAVAWATSAAAAARPGAVCAGDAALVAGELPLRLRYSLPLIRLVNGISDSQQRGRVASSVAVLSDAAGLPRALVDVRHEATHNELPSLPLLRAAADSALTWLRDSYWEGQRQALAAASARIAALLTCLMDSWRAAAAAGLSGGGGAAAAADDEEDEEEQGGEAAAAASYSGAEGQRARRQALSDLRSLLPPAFTHELLAPLLDCPALRPPEGPLATPPFPSQQGQQGQGQQEGATGAQQRQQQAEDMAWRSAMKQVLKWYPRLRLLLLQAALQRLVDVATTGAAPGAPGTCPPGQGATGGCALDSGLELAQGYMRWALRLLPAAALAAQGQSSQGTAMPSPARRQPQQGRVSRKAAPPAAAASGRRQQGAGGGDGAFAAGGRGGDGNYEPLLDGPLSSEQMEALLDIALQGMQPAAGEHGAGEAAAAGEGAEVEAADGCCLAGASGSGEASGSLAAPPERLASGQLGCSASAGAAGPQQCLQAVVDALRRALSLAGSCRSTKRRKLAATAHGAEAPQDGSGPYGNGAGAADPQRADTRLAAAGCTDADATAVGAALGDSSTRPQHLQPQQQAVQSGRRWQRCEVWSRCAIGCLPCPLNPNGRLPPLTCPPAPPPPLQGEAAAEMAGDTAAADGVACAAADGVGALPGSAVMGEATAVTEPPADEYEIPPYESPPQYGGVAVYDDGDACDAGLECRGGQPEAEVPAGEGLEAGGAERAGGGGLFGTLLQGPTQGPASGVGFLL